MKNILKLFILSVLSIIPAQSYAMTERTPNRDKLIERGILLPTDTVLVGDEYLGGILGQIRMAGSDPLFSGPVYNRLNLIDRKFIAPNKGDWFGLRSTDHETSYNLRYLGVDGNLLLKSGVFNLNELNLSNLPPVYEFTRYRIFYVYNGLDATRALMLADGVLHLPEEIEELEELEELSDGGGEAGAADLM